MPREFARRHRVAEELKRELGSLITTEVKDPRCDLAVVTEVDVSPDLKHAKVYVATFDVTADADQPTRIIEGLRAARGFLRRALGKRLHLRAIPELRFCEDTTQRDAQHLSRVIESAVATDHDRRERAGEHGDTPGDDAAT